MFYSYSFARKIISCIKTQLFERKSILKALIILILVVRNTALKRFDLRLLTKNIDEFSREAVARLVCPCAVSSLLSLGLLFSSGIKVTGHLFGYMNFSVAMLLNVFFALVKSRILVIPTRLYLMCGRSMKHSVSFPTKGAEWRKSMSSTRSCLSTPNSQCRT